MSTAHPWGLDDGAEADDGQDVDEFADVQLPAPGPAPVREPVDAGELAEMERLAASVKPRPVTPPPAPPRLVYPTVDRFVAEVLSPMFARPVDGRHLTWCPSWWKHPEAITRLDALWRSWEHLRLDAATGISVWLSMHADHHMRVLMDPDLGPFKACHPDRGHGERLKPLRLVEPPPGLFTE